MTDETENYRLICASTVRAGGTRAAAARLPRQVLIDLLDDADARGVTLATAMADRIAAREGEA